jgi:ABC-type Zn uptake system ZnuABC Zn-binding protein ZnuA
VALVLGLGAAPAAAEPLEVVATVPDLGSLARAVGGDEVEVFVLARGPQDAHFVEPRPSFVRRLHDADLYAQQGMQLEIGWAPVLLQGARNPGILPGGPGHLDASSVIPALEVPTTPVDRSMGDLHPYGNPHYLSDPLNGLRVAALLRDKLSELRPAAAEGFRARYDAFAAALVGKLVGADLVRRHGAEELARRVEDGTLLAFLGEGGAAQLGGWLGLLPAGGDLEAVQDHRLWPYFARRFGLDLIGTLEPLPGIAPTTRHLSDVVERMRRDDVKLILASSYFNPRHAHWVAERTGAAVVPMAHQVGAREGTEDYLAVIDYNVSQVVGAL